MPDPQPTPAAAPPVQPLALGLLKHLRIRCISEIGWLDTPTMLADIAAAGGMSTNQYRLPWPPFGDQHPANAAGSSALIEAETLDGQRLSGPVRYRLESGLDGAALRRRRG